MGWVLKGSIESETNQINSNGISGNNQNLENSIENFWKIDSYSPTKYAYPSLPPQNKKKALVILEKQ